MTALEDAWKRVERWADIDRSSSDLCLLDLRCRVEALEQRALTAPESVATAPAADRPLWAQMAETYYEAPDDPEEWAAVLDVVADWLAAREHCGAASALRAEARRAREGA